MAFKWIRKAQENGAKIIHVDPRFTRTSRLTVSLGRFDVRSSIQRRHIHRR